MTSDSFKKCYQQNVFTNHINLIYIYRYDLALNNLQRLICHKTQPNQINHEQDVTRGQVLSEVQLVWIQNFSFSLIGCLTKAKEPSLPIYL